MADGQIYCYEVAPFSQAMLLQLTGASTLKLEVRPDASSCATLAPYQFGANAFDYVR